MDEEINRIIINCQGKYRVVGDLGKCKICKINFTAISPCIMCTLRLKKEKELGRRLTEREWKELFKFLE